MKKVLTQIKRWWKQLAAILLIVGIASMPDKFIVYNLDVGFGLVTAIAGLLLARFAKSALDTWQSHHEQDKAVSMSKFMAETKNDIAKGIVHAAQIISIALIIFAALSRG